jgi:hypothetical protein
MIPARLLVVAAIAGLVAACSTKARPAPAADAAAKPAPVIAAPAGSASGADASADAAPESSAPPFAKGERRDTGLAFHLVAEFPYDITFAPLGPNALLVTGDWLASLPLLIEANELRFFPELARFDERDAGNISAAWGSWPDNAWLAVSKASDAGPSWSDVFRWTPAAVSAHDGGTPKPQWMKKVEHDPWVCEAVELGDTIILVGRSSAVVGTFPPQIQVLSSDGTPLRRWKSAACKTPEYFPLGPSWVQDGALNLFGYACNESAAPPESATALLHERWSSDGKRTQRRFPLPKDVGEVELVLTSPDGVGAVFPENDKAPRRIAQFENGRFATVASLPADFERVSAPKTFDLWGVSKAQLLLWQRPGWSATVLPTDRKYAGLKWLSVWQRNPTDLWLIAMGQTPGGPPGRHFLFNTADGRKVTPMPGDAEHSRLGHPEIPVDKPPACPHPYADVLNLTPFQLGEDSAIQIRPEDARRALAAAIAQHPELRTLRFVRHRCYGEQCIGAVLDKAEQAETLRTFLAENIADLVKATEVGLPTVDAPPELLSRLVATSALRCVPPPHSTPFPVSAR